ncbi:MAG TPA: hypothetical protein VKU83_08715 [Puia sp.]|nr:hypothetical protein [Puia sp.]
MKRRLLLLLTCAMVMALPACVKRLDLGQRVQEEVKSCPILQLACVVRLNSHDTTEIEIAVHYNAVGNPIAMLHINGAGTLDLRDYHFRYDRYNRLSDYIMNSSGTYNALMWHTYTYTSRNVVVDSVYGENDPAPITARKPNADSYIGVTRHLLDNEGRIIEDQQYWYGGSLKDTTYFQYDAWGNIIRSRVDYDNKFNPYLTNDVWRFVYEDYSVNNPLPENSGTPLLIAAYNAHGLPQILGYLAGTVHLFGYEFPAEMQIIYGCDNGQKENGVE